MPHTFRPETSALIVNPSAAAGRAGRQWKHLSELVRARFGELPIHETTHPGHAVELARSLVESGVEGILVVGGDGTNNEVVDGIMKASPDPEAVTLGQIPLGTGGDFRRSLLHSRTSTEAVRSLPDAPTAGCDVGRIQFLDHDGQPAVRHFLNVASFGIGGVVDRIVNDTPKWLGGKLSFYLGTLRALVQYQPTRCGLRIDDEYVGEFEVTGVFVANGRYNGGGMQIAPDALVDDGLFDVVVLPRYSLLRSVRSMPLVYSGRHVEMESVRVFRAKKVEAHPIGDSVGLLDVDGEPPGRIPATFTICPRAIRVAQLAPEVLQSHRSR